MEHEGRNPVWGRWLIAVLLLAVALVSFIPLAERAEAQETHEQTVQAIDQKIETVLKLTATSTVASAGLSAIPGDTATPIAEKLADFSEYFLVILSVLYAEKYLLTIIGAATFRILIPAACLIAALGLVWSPVAMRKLAGKLFTVGIALYLVIPLSIRVSDMIYATYQTSIDSTIASAEQLADDAAGLAQESDGAEESPGLISGIISRLTEGAESLTERAAEILNRFVETLAVMIVTSCVIPILVLLFFLWIIKLLTGVEIAPPPIPRRHV